MLLVNLHGGPGSGKSTSAAAIFAYLKNRGIRAELVHEAAKRFIYKGAFERQGKNQVYVMSKQWSNIFDLHASGAVVAVSDSPLICNLMYAEGLPYYSELEALALKLDEAYPQVNIFVERTKHFDGFGRNQKTIEEASIFDSKVQALMARYGKKFDATYEGNEEGQREMGRFVMRHVTQVVGFPATGESF